MAMDGMHDRKDVENVPTSASAPNGKSALIHALAEFHDSVNKPCFATARRHRPHFFLSSCPQSNSRTRDKGHGL